MSISKTKAELLRKFVDYKCEDCDRHEDQCGTLQIHRINRGYLNGKYVLRNIKVLCKTCHKWLHGNEFTTK